VTMNITMITTKIENIPGIASITCLAFKLNLIITIGLLSRDTGN
jgi:hypothetical protein